MNTEKCSVVELSRGSTHYELRGPREGRAVVLLHGATIPMWTWDHQAPYLSEAGFRVLRYDMYGRGESSCPPVAYDRDLFIEQLLELLAALKFELPVDLVGYSFGGATAANFTARHPEFVRSLLLVAPSVHYAAVNATIRAIRMPVLGELVFRIALNRLPLVTSHLWQGSLRAAQYMQLFRTQMARPGFRAAMRSFILGDALGDYSDIYRRLGTDTSRRTLLIWGERDKDSPRAHTAMVRDAVPSAEYFEIPAATHGLLFQAERLVNSRMLQFLKAQ